MKVLGISFSYRHGNSQALVEHILKGAKDAGAETELIRFCDLEVKNCKGCGFCKSPGKDTCSIKDDMADLYKKVNDADAVVFGMPVYFGRMNAPAYTFIDRLYAMLNPDFSPRLSGGKKIAVAVTCGTGPAEDMEKIGAYISAIGGFFGWESKGLIYERNLLEKDAVLKCGDKLKEAEKLGKSLTE